MCLEIIKYNTPEEGQKIKKKKKRSKRCDYNNQDEHAGLNRTSQNNNSISKKFRQEIVEQIVASSGVQLYLVCKCMYVRVCGDMQIVWLGVQVRMCVCMRQTLIYVSIYRQGHRFFHVGICLSLCLGWKRMLMLCKRTFIPPT